MTFFSACCSLDTYYLFFPEKIDSFVDEINIEAVHVLGHPILERVFPE